MEPLLRLVVPELDGGMIAPLLTTALGGVNFTFPVVADPASGFFNCTNITGEAARAFGVVVPTDEPYYQLCQPTGSAPPVDLGKPLLAWYRGRLQSQAPLLSVALLLWLLLLAGLAAVYGRLRYLLSGQTQQLGGVEIQWKRLRPLFGLLTLILLLVVIACTFATLHWAGRAGFSGMSDLSNDTAATSEHSAGRNSSETKAGRTHLMSAFRQVIDDFDSFVEQTIIETNATVLAVCQEALPEVLSTLETVATYLLDRLAEDFRVAPLFDAFYEFIDLVKLLVTSMRAIKESRSTVVEPLAEFTTRVESVQADLQKQTADACSRSAPPADLCRRIASALSRLAVGVNYRQLKSDSSVTIVNLLDNMLKLNFSQVEGQVASARSQLYGSLDLVKSEVRKQFKQLVVVISKHFKTALTDAESFRIGLRCSKRDQGFMSAMETVDSLVHGFSITLAIGSFVFLAVLFLTMFVSIRYLLSFRNSGNSNGRSGDHEGADDQVPLRHFNGHNGGVTSNGHPLTDLLHNDDLVMPTERQRTREPRDWHSLCLTISGVLVLAALLYALAVFYAGAEAHMDACRYVTTESGVARLDRLVFQLVKQRLWPQLEDILLSEVAIPLKISSDLIPENLIGSILGQCTNESATIFQALGLTSVSALVNVSQVLRLPMVLNELNKGSSMIQDLVRELNTSSLIPSEVDGLLQNTLPSFAAAVDSENFAPSIRELRQPLLLLGLQDFAELRADLLSLQASLRHANSSDQRAVLIGYFADSANALIRDRNATLSASLSQLLSHYTILQTNRRLTNLTLKLTEKALQLKMTLADKPFLLTSISLRFNETLERHLDTVADLLENIGSRLLDRVGRCAPLKGIFQTPIAWCNTQVRQLPATGVYMTASSFIFYIIVLLLLVLMYLMMRRTVAQGPRWQR